MYAKCGQVTKAESVLKELLVRDVVSWNTLISGYVQNGQTNEAFICYELMHADGLEPDAITYSCMLKACGIAKEIQKGQMIHDEIARGMSLAKNIILGTALVDMYAKCGDLTKAQRVFDELPAHDVVSWNALISGYVLHGNGAKVLSCYHSMQKDGLSADAVTYACVLKACGIIGEVDTGRKIHDEVMSQRILSTSLVVGNALVDMYVKCGMLTQAAKVLYELPIRDVVSWSTLITGYTQQGQTKDAFACFQQMQREGICPNAITYACILKAYGITQEVENGERIHDEITRQRLLEKNVMLGTALIDMYAKCGALTKAQKLLNELPSRDTVSWSALIGGYAQQGRAEEAFNCFQQMLIEGITPDVISWNALIVGFAQKGQVEDALSCFQWMQCEGFPPNAVTFTCVLNACGHSGLVNQGQTYFENIARNDGIMPSLEHHTCMVDMFVRAGQFDKAMTVFTKLASYDHLPICSSLLNACRNWGHVQLGRLIFERIIQLNKHDAAAYTCMAEIYADAGMQEDAKKIKFIKAKIF
ncbi:hypothetical protein KP509_24G008500 [Ceratopteris richardii]|nr:hypothetical protein KP509_24G008500 [Ceratopteris richardii]